MRHGSLLSAVILTTMAVFLTGCSRNPVAPSTDLSNAPGAASATISPIPEDSPPSDGGTPLSRTVSLVATDEGVVVVGRWTLWLRKNTLQMPATVTLRVTDPEAMQVDIEVQPPAANLFKQPAILTANMSDVQGFDYSTGMMFYWANGDWQQAGSASSHPNQQNVVGHFTSLTKTMVGNTAGKKGKLGA